MTVLDASALLALLNDEPGADRVAEALASDPIVSAVNLSEVAAKLADIGLTADERDETLALLGLTVAPFDRSDALRAASLRDATKTRGLSLGDRACLALGLHRKAPVMTADRTWDGLVDGVAIVWVRP